MKLTCPYCEESGEVFEDLEGNRIKCKVCANVFNNTKKSPPVRQMIVDAVKALGGAAANVAIRDWILSMYPGTNINTIQTQIIVCTVNHLSRVHMPENNHPSRVYIPGKGIPKIDNRFDCIYRIKTGWVELYEPQKHGLWCIIRGEDGKLAISQYDSGQYDSINYVPAKIETKPDHTLLTLTIPITREQIDVASNIFLSTPSWSDGEKVFALLRDKLPGFSYEEVVAKAAAVNDLYSTRIFDLLTVSRRVSKVMSGDHPDNPVELVTMLAAVENNGKTKHYWSFTSKFTHFFIDKEQYPIYDSYNDAMLRYHLGRNAVKRSDNPYKDFRGNLDRFKELGGLNHISNQLLDHYLWVAGLYRDWLKGNIYVNREAREMFSNPGDKMKQQLNILMPPGYRPVKMAEKENNPVNHINLV